MNIRLPGFVIAGLYKDLLVIAGEVSVRKVQIKQQVNNKTTKPETSVTTLPKKWYLGNNRKNIVIIVKDISAVFINDEWLSTLGKLLAACKLNLADVAIINCGHNNITFAAIKDALLPQRVFMFDVTTEDIQLPFAIPYYQVQQYGGCTFMTAQGSTLSAGPNTEATAAEKRKLWEKLRVIFTV